MTVRRIAFAAAAVLFSVPVVAALRPPAIPIALKLLSAAILLSATAEPLWGLLIVAGLAPLVTPLVLLARGPFTGDDMADLLVAPLLVGAAIRASASSNSSAGRLFRPAMLFATLVAASGLLLLAHEQRVTQSAASYASTLWAHLVDSYFANAHDWVTLHTLFTWLESLALVVVAESVVRTRPGARRAAVTVFLAGLAGAAALSVLRLVEVSLRREHPWQAAGLFLRTLRMTPLYQDVNAAGSCLALAAVATIWCTRDRQWRWAMLTAPVVLVALWLTGSRTALAAVFVGLAAAWVLERRPARRSLVIGAAAVAVIAPIALWNPGRFQSSTSAAAIIRFDLTRVGLDIARDHPWFGVGLGRFQSVSKAYITPDLIARFPTAVDGENAHDNFIQILAEFGLAGAIAFLWMLTAAGQAVWRTSRAGLATPAIAGWAGGVVAFFATCLAGHPLLTPQVAYIAFLALGLTAGLLPTPPPAEARPRERIIWLAAMALVVISVPFRFMNDRADDASTVIGASALTSTPDGVPFRVAAERSTWFIATAARSVSIPLRLGDRSTGTCQVGIAVDGQPADTVSPSLDVWLPVSFALPPARRGASHRRIDLRVLGPTPTRCTLMVGVLVPRP